MGSDAEDRDKMNVFAGRNNVIRNPMAGISGVRFSERLHSRYEISVVRPA